LFNPEREFIGARIRADIYGMTNPGNPELAAESAFRDATLTHTKNGVYSAMFTAACISWAFTSNDLEEIIRVGLSEIPANCRLAENICEVINVQQKEDNWETAYKNLLEKQASYHPVHAINNTIWMVLSILYGNGDFEKTICTAVMCGFDTDCNAANAGTILGIITGSSKLPTKWTYPLHDTLRSSVAEFADMRISDLAERTAKLVESTNARTHTRSETCYQN
jgi:ADP-ribosylglycohydrolase